MEVRDPEDVAELCNALSHPNRVHLYRLLEEHDGAFLADLVTMASQALPKPLNYMTVKHHVHTLAEAGVVELGKRDGQFFVTLKRPNIRILEGPPEAQTELSVER
ncbi:MAG: helix-turn-helix domain-containing protein [Candidatus Thermoplasmatota archaeon]|nr:helix-turn-helix domain-containing protein [Candidatus Thermoplasmatota archaeon]